ncbi:hypothetical protein L6241_04010 [Janibacter sp. Y6]|uniref:hypothetical protein n=1 Tax=Janibacter sp. Y6 TaxID=2913552 RepID=UPI0034A4EEF6
MQATVFSNDADGVVLVTDTGRRLRAPFSAFAGSGLIHVLPGQRLSVELGADDQVSRAWVVGIGEGERID